MATLLSSRNGVNVEAIQATAGALARNRALGRFTFRSRAKWINGAHSQSTFDSYFGTGEEHPRAMPHFMEGDEPVALLGHDLAPNAAEVILHALTTCMSASYAYHAAAMGLEIISLSFETETDLDLAGFMDVDPTVRPGLSHLWMKVHLYCTGTEEQVQDLHAKVQRTSPILDSLRNPLDVRISTP